MATAAALAEARIIGIDDWAGRKGQRYGTPICDLERRRVIDLLPDREPATVEAWLRAHPQVELVARDRNGGYGSAIAKAVQVADRWHLLENVSAALLTAVRSSMPGIRKANPGLMLLQDADDLVFSKPAALHLCSSGCARVYLKLD